MLGMRCFCRQSRSASGTVYRTPRLSLAAPLYADNWAVVIAVPVEGIVVPSGLSEDLQGISLGAQVVRIMPLVLLIRTESDRRKMGTALSMSPSDEYWARRTAKPQRG